MPNPAQPIEKRQLLGNPSRRPIPAPAELPELPSGVIQPLRPLGDSGLKLWAAVFDKGALWVSSRTDAHLLQMTCEQIDRREKLAEAFDADPTDRALNMNLNELEKIIASNLGLLGFTPSDRSKLGFTLAKTESKLSQLMARNET